MYLMLVFNLTVASVYVGLRMLTLVLDLVVVVVTL